MSQDDTEDYGKRLLKGLVLELVRRLEDPEEKKKFSAAEGELVRKLCADGSVTLSSIRRGDFGEVAKRAAEEFPFPEGGAVQVGNA